MRDVAIASFRQDLAFESDRDEVEMLVPVLREALAAAGITKDQVGFTVSGSCDYNGGRPFSFVMALDAVGAWPPISESHVEMDGAWALYEAWVRLQHGDVDIALVYAFGKSTQGNMRDVLVAQLDPYYLAPLATDPAALAGLQARAMLEAKRCTEEDIAEVALRSRKGAAAIREETGGKGETVSDLLAQPYVASPLRAHDCSKAADGVAAMVLVAGDAAKRAKGPLAWIRGIDHRVEPQGLGFRDLTTSASTRLAATRAGANGRRADVVEIHAPYAHQELLVREALGVTGAPVVNATGGALAKNAFTVSGLCRIGEAASKLLDGSAQVAVAHATSGPCLQQNLVCVLERS